MRCVQRFLHYRNIADWIGIAFTYDLTRLPAIAEDGIVKGIQMRDVSVIGDRKEAAD